MDTQEIKLSTIGYANIDFDVFVNWYESDEAFDWINGRWKNHFYNLQGSGLDASKIYDNICGCTYSLNDYKPSEDGMKGVRWRVDGEGLR